MQVDNSTLRTYTDCNVKGMLSHVMHRKPKVEGEASWFGQQFHKFPQYYWQPGDKWKQVLLEYEQRYEAFLSKQAQLGRINDGETINPSVYLNMARQFVAQLPRLVNDNGEVILFDASSKEPIYKVRHRPEISFRFPIGEDEFVGRLDCLLEDFNGNLWVSDIKTTSKYRRNKATGEAEAQFSWKEYFDLSTQLSGYVRAVQYNTGLTVAGAIVFAIPRVKDKLRIDHLRKRRTRAALDQWEIDTERLIRRYKFDAEFVKEHGPKGLEMVIPTGKYSGACTRFGVCPYFDICKYNYAPGIIEQTTIHQVWDPLVDASEEKEC